MASHDGLYGVWLKYLRPSATDAVLQLHKYQGYSYGWRNKKTTRLKKGSKKRPSQETIDLQLSKYQAYLRDDEMKNYPVQEGLQKENTPATNNR